MVHWESQLPMELIGGLQIIKIPIELLVSMKYVTLSFYNPISEVNTMEEKYQDGLLQIQGAPSGYASWVDYSKRMKPQNADDADWEQFIRKYYGFIISRCRNKDKGQGKRRGRWHLTDPQTQDIVGEVFMKMYKGKRFEYTKSKGSFHSWFAMIINDTIVSYLKKQYAQKNFRNKKGESLLVDIDVDLLSEEDNVELSFKHTIETQDYLAMLAWEDVCESSKNPRQQQFFTWSLQGAKPREIAQRCGVKSTEVSELIRQFKNKLITAYKRLDDAINTDQLDCRSYDII